jgi:outer membrane protein OmpA-like peptidoglycan-associated protein
MTLSLRNALALCALLLFSTVAVGCSSMNSTSRGAVIGAGAGGAVGGVIGRATGNTAQGAIIGAAVGGAAGAIIGRQMDQQAEELDEELANAEVTPIEDPQTGETAGIAVTFDNAILFDFGKSTLKPQARADLSELAASLQRYDNTDVVVYGHTDDVGSDSFNMSLSEQRAESAASYLMSQGIPRYRITTVGKGETEPIATNSTDQGRALNRRVEIAIFANEAFQQEARQQAGRGR